MHVSVPLFPPLMLPHSSVPLHRIQEIFCTQYNTSVPRNACKRHANDEQHALSSQNSLIVAHISSYLHQIMRQILGRSLLDFFYCLITFVISHQCCSLIHYSILFAQNLAEVALCTTIIDKTTLVHHVQVCVLIVIVDIVISFYPIKCHEDRMIFHLHMAK